MARITVTAEGLRKFYPPQGGNKTGAAFVIDTNITSNGRRVRTIEFRRNNIVTLSGPMPGPQRRRWTQTYRNTVPIDD